VTTSQSRALVALGVLGILGCTSRATVPFEKIPRASVADVQPEEILAEFAAALPVKFRVLNTVTFDFKGRALAAIGYTDVDSARDRFTVVGLHPAGVVKLFEVCGSGENVESAFAIDELARRGDVGRSIGEATRRMYFDRIPNATARMRRETGRLVFTQRAGDGRIKYSFGGPGGVLAEKRYYERGREVWRVSYHEYRSHKGKLYPGGIVLTNQKYGYRVVVRLREIMS